MFPAASITKSDGSGLAFRQIPRISRRKMFTVTLPMPFANAVSRSSRSGGPDASACSRSRSP